MFSDESIQFTPLRSDHFSLLLKWLETPHVKLWWDRDLRYTLALVQENFGLHTHGLPIGPDAGKRTYAYVAEHKNIPVGYIQAYDARAFAGENGLLMNELPGLIAGCDLFIGEDRYLGRGLGTGILKAFCESTLAPHFDACLVDPDPKNHVAIRAYNRVGFKIISNLSIDSCLWMIKILR